MRRYSYRCPNTERPLGTSVTVQTIDEVEPVKLDTCPECGELHVLCLDDLYPDPASEGGDGAGVREPRQPPPDSDDGLASAAR
jgi:hypothetical protein